MDLEVLPKSLGADAVYLVVSLAGLAAYLIVLVNTLRHYLKRDGSQNGQANFILMAFSGAFVLMFFVNTLTEAFRAQPALRMILLGIGFLPLPGLLLLRAKFFAKIGESFAAVQKFDKMKDEFLSVASHELRTPLAIINGFAEILVREKLGTLNDEQKRRVRKILMQAQRLNHIIDNLLDLSRIRSGKIEIRKEVFDLVPVLKSCLDDLQIVCDQQHITLVDEVNDVIPDVLGDLDRTTQVVVNLLNNALKYTHPGGTVRMRAFHDSKTSEVRVEVQDTGIGITPDDQPHVFKEFFRVADQQARKYAGSGLGLAIVKQLVDSMGGQVGLHSEGLGHGTTFFFTLPIHRGRVGQYGPDSEAK
jgi:signal transduction histidine kinase